MNRKDIALTVVGVLATAGLSYLLYREQQKTSAANTAQQAAAQQAATDAANTQYNNQQSFLASLGSQSYGGSGGYINNTLSSTTAPPSTIPTQSNDPVTQALSYFMSAASPSNVSSTSSPYLIPALNAMDTSSTSTSGIPTTATAAQSGVAANTISNSQGIPSAPTPSGNGGNPTTGKLPVTTLAKAN